MNLEELLEYTGKEYLDDRTELVDGDPDVLWPDKTLVRYFNEAQRRLCRRSWVLIDTAHAQAGVLVLGEGKSLYKLHKSVLRVISATPDGAAVPLPRTTAERLAGYRPQDPDYFDVNLVQALTPGAPLAYTTDAGTRLLQIVPEPAAAQTGLKLFLKVARMPACDLNLDKPKDAPEVDEQWHQDILCKYAAGKCLTHPNADATAKTEGRALLKEVEATIKEARQERERAEMAEPRFLFASTTACL